MKPITPIALFALAAFGCSSSSTTINVNEDGGHEDTGTPKVDSGKQTPDAGKDSGKSDSGKQTTDAGVDATEFDAGPDNHTVATAEPVTVDNQTATPGTLQDPMTPNYYSFTGTAGDRYLILAGADAYAVANANLADPTVIDTVVTVYKADGTTLVAQDDDEWPRYDTDSQLFVELPADGTYYFSVEDCNLANGPADCSPAAGITQFGYTVSVIDLTTEMAETVGVATPGTPNAVTNTQSSSPTTGVWEDSLLDGTFSAAGEVQTISFAPPTTTDVEVGARPRAYFWLQPNMTSDGDGSLANVLVTVKDKNGVVVAQADQANYANGDTLGNGPMQLSFPLYDTSVLTPPAAAPSTLGDNYTLVLTNEAGTFTADSDYYFFVHTAGSLDYGQAEAELPGATTNDTGATAEALTIPTGATFDSAFFADGNLATVGDVDWYSIAVPSDNANTVSLICSAGRDGSGLLGFKAELFADAAGTTSVTSLTEVNPAKIDLEKDSVSLAGATKLYLKISATGQDATNTGTYYNCAVETSM
jgi:hypothetical protein